MTLQTAADGSRVEFWYAIEDSAGDISATVPDFVPIRFNSADPTRDTAQVESAEINPSRQQGKDKQGTFSIQGSIAAELTKGSHDYLMQAALQSAWVSQITMTEVTISAVAADNSYNDTGSAFITNGFRVTDLVTVEGFTGDTVNNLIDAKVTALTAGKMTIGGTEGDVIVDDAAGESVTIKTAGDYLEVGLTVPTISLLRRNKDTGVDVIYRHNRVSDLAFAVVLDQSALITANIIGETMEIYTVPGGSTFAAVTTTEMMVPTVGSMQDAKAAVTFLTDYNVAFTNQMEANFALFQRGAHSVSNGNFKASGSMSAYQPDAVLLTKFINETGSDHVVKLIDDAGAWYRIILPDVGYITLSDPVSGPGKHIHSYGFSAGYDGTTTVRLERSI